MVMIAQRKGLLVPFGVDLQGVGAKMSTVTEFPVADHDAPTAAFPGRLERDLSLTLNACFENVPVPYSIARNEKG